MNKRGFAIIIYLSFLLLACKTTPRSQYLVELPNGNYILALDIDGSNLKHDTSIIYIGDPILFSFISHTETIRFDIYIGTKNPIIDWKWSFDFDEKQFDLKEQVAFDPERIFVREGKFRANGSIGRFVQYKEKVGQRIEGQFTSGEIITINVVLKGHSHLTDLELLKKFQKIIRTVKVGQ